MPESKNPEPIKNPQEISCFPVTKDSVDATLYDIKNNMIQASLREGLAIQQQNPNLLRLLQVIGSSPPFILANFFEGGLWMHKLLREQAEFREASIPHVSEDSIVAYYHDQVRKSPENILQLSERAKKTIEKEEPELGRALETLSKEDPLNSYSGAFFAYSLIRKAVDSKELEKKLGL